MLYVFQVDTGSMITFDMNLALESVHALKLQISAHCRIPEERQVLLVSGGETLENDSRVCSYSAGTDTNPIFLFNKQHIESSPTSSGQNTAGNQLKASPGSLENLALLADIDNIKDQIESCLALPPTYMTVVSRCQLAQQLWDMAKDVHLRCENLIHDQHLMHQGWAAVVANLEDTISSFSKRLEGFEKSWVEYLAKEGERSVILENFETHVHLLDEIEVIPSLLEPSSDSMTLLDWIKSQDSSPLESIASSCKKSFENLDPTAIENLQRESRAVIEKGGQTSMKEIKGLEERLFGLDQLLIESKKLVQEQYELSQAFLQNQNRASEIKDSSIFPDLCQSHQHQLLVMQRNHTQLEDIRRRCMKAKDELSSNLHARLKWVMFVQRNLVESSNRVTVYGEGLKRGSCQIQILEQIMDSKAIYLDCVKEVWRRRRFSDAYLAWATELSEKVDNVYKTEVSARKEFAARVESHFLFQSHFFPGLEDFPTPFANTKPEQFDLQLPEVTQADIDKLKEKIPSLTFEESTPDLFSLVPSSSEHEQATTLELMTLRMDLEAAQTEVQSKADEILEITQASKNELEKVQSELNNTKTLLEKEMEEKQELIRQKDAELENLQTKSAELEETISKLNAEVAEKLESLEKAKAEWENSIKECETQHELELGELKEQLQAEKESELKEAREKAKADFEGLRSRFRLMSSMEQRSPSTDNIDRSLDSFEKLPKSDDLSELFKALDIVQRQNPEGMSPQLIRRIVQRLEGNMPGPSQRTRNASETGARLSFEVEDEATIRSVYGLDTSAVDATTMYAESSDPAFRELAEILTPPQRVVNAASKLVQQDRISLQSCKTNDTVFLYWNEKLYAYLVYLNAKNVHFLHTDCLKLLNPGAPTEGFLAQVLEKEFCVARRAQNRYRVPQGFHFYRVKVKVLDVLDLSVI